MGNKSNVLTLRSINKGQGQRLNLNEFLYSYLLLKNFLFLFTKKKLFLTKSNVFLVENKVFLTLFVFFRVALLSKFYKLKKSTRRPSLVKKKIFIFFRSLQILRKNLIFFTFINLNFFLKKKKKKISFFLKH